MKKLTVESVARYFEVSKPTVRKDIKAGHLSVEQDARGGRKIDIAEAMRVYKLNSEGRKMFSDNADSADRKFPETVSVADVVELAKLRVKTEFQEKERDGMEEQINYLRGALNSERQERTKITAILTDQRATQEKEAERKEHKQKQLDAISDSMKELEAKNAEQIEQLKRQNRVIRSELQENQKSLWAKLFGAKPTQRRPVATRKQSAQ